MFAVNFYKCSINTYFLHTFHNLFGRAKPCLFMCMRTCADAYVRVCVCVRVCMRQEFHTIIFCAYNRVWVITLTVSTLISHSTSIKIK